MIDLSKIKPGDEVTVRMTVMRFIEGDLGRFVVADAGFLAGLDPAFDVARIVSHTPALAVGDRVRNARCASYPPAYTGGEIMAIANGWAMVRFCETPGTVKLDDLERIDA